MAIGALSNFQHGRQFSSRRELFDADVHRALQAGIVGAGATGAESIVLSGGYTDDEDYGNVVIYTGHGGRDPDSGRQIADQTFTYQNQAPVRSSLLAARCGSYAAQGATVASPRPPVTVTTGCFGLSAIGKSAVETAFWFAAIAWLLTEPWICRPPPRWARLQSGLRQTSSASSATPSWAAK
jgi:hypothetical protein